MPTYQYRCQSCQRERTIAHGMLEDITVVCEVCGHFCQKITQSAPVILSFRDTSSPEPEVMEPTHECGASCVLHSLSSQTKQAE